VEYVAPQTELEEQLVSIWCELLDLDRVGIHDNFFDLGGHSLMAIRAVSRIHELSKLELSVASLFEHSTIAGLAEYIETMRWINDSHADQNLDTDEHRQIGEL
jgi:acyl carrier protein